MSKLETNTIDTVSGTSTLQVGSTNTTTITLGVSGDTINVPSGVTINNNGTQTGFGGTNTPCFQAYASGTLAVNDSVYTTLAFNNDSGSDGSIIGYDEGGCYNDTSGTVTLNGISTPAYSFAPNVAGKYRLTSFFAIDSTENDLHLVLGRISKNANTTSGLYQFYWHKTPASLGVERQGLYLSAIVDANGTSDYFSIIAYADVGSGDSTVFTTNNFAFFAGEKLIT